MLAAMALSSCSSGAISSAGCSGQVVRYSMDRQHRAAAEIEAMPAGSVLPQMMTDYAALRAYCRGR